MPKFGGKGMYGDRVHQAVLDAKETESGATVHYVTDGIDEGPIIKHSLLLLKTMNRSRLYVAKCKVVNQLFTLAHCEKFY